MGPGARLERCQLLVVTGKGGVGKTAVAAALGRVLAAAGRRTLVIEVDPRENLHQMLGLPPSGGAIVPAGSGLWAQNLKPGQVLDDVVRDRLKVGLLARRVLASPVYQQFSAAAPGLKELAILGQAARLLRPAGSAANGGSGGRPAGSAANGGSGGRPAESAANSPPRTRRAAQAGGSAAAPGPRASRPAGSRLRPDGAPEIDTVVLDAPASGHGVRLLAAPRLVADVIRTGPFGTLAGELAGFVADPERCGIVVVTQAEEMPVEEALELREALSTQLGREPELLVVNGLFPPLGPGREVPTPFEDGLLTLWRHRRFLNERELARLARWWDGPRVELPQLAMERGPELIAALQQLLAAGLAAAGAPAGAGAGAGAASPTERGA
jgi:hypothetical protein